MSGGGEPKKVPGGKVLPARRAAIGLPPTTQVVPFWERLGLRSQSKTVDAYRKVAEAENALMRALDDGNRLRVQLEISSVRIDNLEALRRTEELKIANELAALTRHAQQERLRNEVEVEELKLRLVVAQKAREALENPPATPEEKSDKRTMAERLRDEIAALREREQVLIASLLGERSEDLLSADERDLIDDVRLSTRNLIKSLIEEPPR